jgi:hypothetical protein
MIGDQDVTSAASDVLNMLKGEKPDLILLAGDIGYGEPVDKWKKQLAAHFPDDFPFLMAAGNHDWDWGGQYGWDKEVTQKLIYDRASRVGTCKGYTGVNMVCTFKGVTIVHVAPGVAGKMHDKFIAQAFAAYPSRWRICVWHKNQQKMQLGGKSDEAGWQVYEECRRQGAIIQTGHDHQYARTHTMSGFENQKVHSQSNTIQLQHEIASSGSTPSRVGTTFAFVNGLGGSSIRVPEQNRHQSPWWAKTLSGGKSFGDANYGAVICEFNVGGANRASCQFKERDGKVRDTWTLETNVPNTATTTAGSASFGTDHEFLVSELVSGKDDVVEEVGGSQDCNNTSLELTERPGQPPDTKRMVGIRFANVELDPSRAKHVVAARIDFTVLKETNATTPAAFFIRAEQVKNSAQLCGPELLSGRPATTQEVRWQPEPFDGGGENIKANGVVSTPNLASLVKEIVNTGWQQDGPMTFFISGEGGRVLHSFENDPSHAPMLIVELEEPVTSSEDDRSSHLSGSAPLSPGSVMWAILGLFAVTVLRQRFN